MIIFFLFFRPIQNMRQHHGQKMKLIWKSSALPLPSRPRRGLWGGRATNAARPPHSHRLWIRSLATIPDSEDGRHRWKFSQAPRNGKSEDKGEGKGGARVDGAATGERQEPTLQASWWVIERWEHTRDSTHYKTAQQESSVLWDLDSVFLFSASLLSSSSCPSSSLRPSPSPLPPHPDDYCNNPNGTQTFILLYLSCEPGSSGSRLLGLSVRVLSVCRPLPSTSLLSGAATLGKG